ncbi:MAG: hypothetical protein LBR06_02655 [Bacteroidales bacterium]|jgi:hypothetical protein|nr:hypothetical protein [Bacteroidales bacterium]
MKLILIITATTVVLAALIILTFYGVFRKVRCSILSQGGEFVIYEELVGDYEQAPVIYERIYDALLNTEHIKTRRNFATFYDNPQSVDTSHLRSDVGCILDEVDDATIALLSRKYKLKTLYKGPCVVAEFPMRSSLSVMFGLKVYPAMNRFMTREKLEGGAITEIYDVPNKRIIYRQEILK